MKCFEHYMIAAEQRRSGTATRTKFGAYFWRRLIANIDLAQNDPKDPFGATIW